MENVSDSISRIWHKNKRSFKWSALAIRTCLILLLLSAFISRPAFSQAEYPGSPAGPMPIWNLQTVDGPRYFTNMTDRALAFKPNGIPCTAYGGDALYYACYDTGTGSWSSIILDNSIYVGQYAALTFYKIPLGATEAFISYYDAYNGQLKLIYTINGTWQPPITVPNPAPGTLTPVLHTPEAPEVENPNNLPEDQVSLQDESSTAQAPWLNNANKTDPNFPIPETKGVGKHTSIAVNYRGVYISYYDDRDVNLDPAHPCLTVGQICERNLKLAHWDFNAAHPWKFDLVDDYHDQGRVGLWSSIKIDYEGNLHIAYMSEKYDTLKYAFWDQSKPEWWVMTVDGAYPETLGSMCSIALLDYGSLGIAGVPVISYLDFAAGRLKIAKLNRLKDNVWGTKIIDNDGNTGWWSSIAVDGDEKIYISYYNATNRDLMYAVGKFSGTWTIKMLRSKLYGAGLYSSLALSPATGRPSIVHYNMTLGRLEHTYQISNNEWNTLAIDYAADVGYASSLKITDFGQPNIAYLNVTAGNLKYALPGFPASTWVNYYPVFGPNLGLFNSLALYNGYMPRVATYVTEGENAAFGKNTGTGWQFEYIDRTYKVGQYISLAMDSNDRPHVSYWDETHQNLIYATKINATDWQTMTLDTTNNVGLYTSIAMSTDDRAYISYFDDTNERLKLIYQSPPFKFWTDPIVIDDGGLDEVGRYTSLALDSSQNPHISYYDETNGNLKYAYWDGSSHVETVPDPDSATHDLGRFTSIAINQADDSVHICYFDYTARSVKYARYDGAWNFQTVDNVGDTGYSCSIDLNSSGQPAISYYDNTNANLRIALSFVVPNFPFHVFLPIIQ